MADNSPYGPDIISLVTIPDSVALSGTISSNGTVVTKCLEAEPL